MVILIFLFLFYIAPLIISLSRNHKNKVAISALTILTGWTVLGWLIAFIWSLTYQEHKSFDEKKQ
jgi:ABC-type transport system involved in cytochrome c biogenesis permease component